MKGLSQLPDLKSISINIICFSRHFIRFTDIHELEILKQHFSRKLKDHLPIQRTETQVELLNSLRYKKDTVERYWTVRIL